MNPIDPYNLEIDSGTAGPRLVILAGVHGDELEPIIAAKKLADCLRPTAGVVEIIPIVNPSAVEAGKRLGSDDLDLARSCPGDPAGSATQQAAFRVSERIRQADYLIDLHTGGTLFDIHPLVGYMLHSTTEILRIQRSMAKCFGMKIIWGTSASLKGRTLSVARDHNIPAIYVEYGGGNGARIDVIEAYINGCKQVMNFLGMGTKDYVAAEPDYWLEDARESSGYLQQMLPSPANGIFIPYLDAGTPVSAAQPIGVVQSLTDGDEITICAPQEGVYFFKRISARVKTGDSLGGIITAFLHQPVLM